MLTLRGASNSGSSSIFFYVAIGKQKLWPPDYRNVLSFYYSITQPDPTCQEICDENSSGEEHSSSFVQPRTLLF